MTKPSACADHYLGAFVALTSVPLPPLVCNWQIVFTNSARRNRAKTAYFGYVGPADQVNGQSGMVVTSRDPHFEHHRRRATIGTGLPMSCLARSANVAGRSMVTPPTGPRTGTYKEHTARVSQFASR